MDGDSGDGVVVRELVQKLKAKVVCMGGRGSAWVSDAFLRDAHQVIRTHAGEFKKYCLIGISMGGTQALALAGLLPEDLRRPIAGVVAIIPGVNLPAIAANSSHERVKNTLRDSVKGDLGALENRSPTKVMTGYASGLPFVVFHNQADTLLLSDELRPFITQLREKGHPVATFSAPGDHNFTYKNFDYEAALKCLGSDGDGNEPPLSD
jgi:pimeloyl-ACP methyl ester carboxylesterase